LTSPVFTPGNVLESLLACLTARRGVDATTAVPGLCLALSGGLDSTVLLVALVEAQQACDELACAARAASHPDAPQRPAEPRLPPLRAIHVEHGLHANCGSWTDASRRLAASYCVPCQSVRIDARAGKGESPEAAARAARYAALAQRLQPGEVLLTAHHADDQMETVLLQWLRGGGLRALAGMPAMAPFGDRMWHARPLLPFTRDSLRAWAESRHLQWAEDPSNADRRFDRNYLRHEVLPGLRQRWPAAAHTVGRVARYAADGVEATDALAAADLADCAAGAALALPRLGELTDARQRGVLRAWLTRLGLPLPSAQSLAVLRSEVLLAARDRNPAVDWPGAVVHRYRDRLYALPRERFEASTGDWIVAPGERRVQRNCAALEWVTDTGVGLSRARLPQSVRVARRVGGEHFVPAGGAYRRPLRKWFQERGVLPWRRDEIPLIFTGDTLIAIGDLACAEEYAAREGESSLRIVWHGRGVVTEADAIRFDWREAPPIR
jgi:tRNA(Ile)-lysidine synthase